MGRLIDIDDLLEQIGLEDTEENREDNVGEIITLEDLDRVPTAYDVDKVIGELDDLQFYYDNDYLSNTRVMMFISYEEVMEIVKKGGIA